MKSCAIEGVDLLAGFGFEGQVEVGGCFGGLEEAEGGLACGKKSMPNEGGPSEAMAAPTGSRAFRKKALLVEELVAPNSM